MHSQKAHAPPLPHQPQAHFYGAPDIDFGQPKLPAEEKKRGEGLHCFFDSLASAGDETSRSSENVLLVGSDHVLDVYNVDRSHLKRIGRIEGLRGSVLGAKILPSTSRNDPIHSFRPLVALEINGPYCPTEPMTETGRDEDALFDPSDSTMQLLSSAEIQGPNPVTYFQTTVEVYSLRKGEHIATLFRGAKTRVETGRNSTTPLYPLSEENLGIQANGRFVIISSGTSGEVFIFEGIISGIDVVPFAFKCLGKVWTKVPPRKTRSLSTSSNSSEPLNLHDQSTPRIHRPDAAIVSLSHRWLAVVPPVASAQSTLHAVVNTAHSAQKPPGLTSHTSPAEPQVTCDLDTPDGESMLNKVARDVTQELMKSAKWVGDQGIQVWNNYWTKPAEQNLQTHPNSFPRNPATMSHMNQAFPPTHAHDETSPRARNQPALVSIIDLEKLSESQNSKPALGLQPIATFSLPYGCSLVSFAPSGLSLLTASAKGDVQHIWDLMRMGHGGAGFGPQRDLNASGKRPEKGPTVRQITLFTRLTVASIVDVVWTKPRGERLAIVTERGTVHIYDLPPTAFQWPPPRRVTRSASVPSNQSMLDDPSTTLRPASSGNTFSAALDVVVGRTQPLLSAVRGRPTSISNPLTALGGLNFTAGASVKGGKVVAAGFNKSLVGAATGTVHTIRHMGENRLALPGSSETVVAGCVRWLGGKDQELIAVVGGGILRIHSIRQSTNSKGGQRRPSVVSKRPIEYSLLKASNDSANRAFNRALAVENDIRKPSTSAHGYWLSPSGNLPKPARNNPHPLSCAEIETNAPYQPFHTDRRINFYVYDDASAPDTYHLDDVTPWGFGEPIPSTKVKVSSAVLDDETDTGRDMPAPMENLISLEGNDDGGQQVVVTTRRKRGKKGETLDRDEGEFFEDDCEVVDFAEQRV